MLKVFGNKNKNPNELSKQLSEQLTALEKAKDGDTKKTDKIVLEIGKILSMMKQITATANPADTNQAAPDAAADPESHTTMTVLCHNLLENNLLLNLIQVMGTLDFDSRRDLVVMFSSIIQWQIGGRTPVVEYLAHNTRFFTMLINAYWRPELAQSAGQMIRYAAKHDALVEKILNLPEFYELFQFIDVSSFDVSSDSLTTFRECLVRHKAYVAIWLEQNYDEFFNHYNKLLTTENYVSKRQALRLLGELLLDRHNFAVMQKYITSTDNLKLIMKLLRDQSKNIQFEAFHVFKIFVANPSKPPPIVTILIRNRDKLISFLGSFQAEKNQDEQFIDEKAYLIKQLKEMVAVEGSQESRPGTDAGAATGSDTPTPNATSRSTPPTESSKTSHQPPLLT